MSLWSVLLRLALCLTLALNPATAAVATTHMQHGHGDREAMAAPRPDVSMATAEDMPCHHHQAAADSHEEVAAFHPATGKSRPSAPDCCKSGGCHCMQHAQLAISVVVITPARIARADIVRKVSQGHASPALPHLIRPPIG